MFHKITVFNLEKEKIKSEISTAFQFSLINKFYFKKKRNMMLLLSVVSFGEKFSELFCHNYFGFNSYFVHSTNHWF